MVKKFEKIIDLAVRRGFFYPSSEIYGGKAGFYDYGSLGKALKENWINLWKKFFLNLHPNFWEIEPANIMVENVFKASGHLEHFNDPIVECEQGHRFRADKLIEEKLKIKAEGLSIEELSKIIEESDIRCPICGSKLGRVKWFNLMFPVFVGPEIGNFFAKLEKLNRYFRINKLIEKLKKKKKLKKTEDGIEFISIIKDVFEKDIENVFYYVDDRYFYIINVKTLEFLRLDIGTRTAEFFVKEKYNPKKYEKVDVELEFERFLDKIEPIYEEIDILSEINDLLKYYNDILKDRMFLRPETAQGPYINFPREIVINRNKLPLGLAVVGKAYRNEISPRNALIRMREFTQAELQIFFDYEDWVQKFEEFNFKEIEEKELQILPVKYRSYTNKFIKKKVKELKEELNLPEFYLYFLYKVQQFYLDVLGIPKEKFRLRELDEKEKAFYNMYHFDVELYIEALEDWIEVGGIHFRAIKIKKDTINNVRDKKLKQLLERLFENKEEVLVGYDLFNHLLLSKNSFFLVQKDKRVIIPVELELSFGVDRNIFAILDIFYKEEKVKDEYRIVLKLPSKLSPIKAAVFPLVSNNKEILNKSIEIYNQLLDADFRVYFDRSGSIGRRYRRQDEIGTPFCITIDYQTLKDDTVTVRFRDTMKQVRVRVHELKEFLIKNL